MKKSKKIALIIIAIIIIIPVVVYNVKIASVKKMVEIENKYLSDYFWLASPNGNGIGIIKNSSTKYHYYIKSYEFEVNDSSGTYVMVMHINSSGTRANHPLMPAHSATTNFPQNIIAENDCLNEQLLVYYKFKSDISPQKESYLHKRCISFNKSYSYNETLSMLDELKQYGNITWLWVDTYSNVDNTENVVTIQNPYDKNGIKYRNSQEPLYIGKTNIGVYGIPLFYGGEETAEPLTEFLSIVNGLNESKYYIETLLYNNVRLGIKPDGTPIEESDVKIIGAVFLPFDTEFDSEIIRAFDYANVVTE